MKVPPYQGMPTGEKTQGNKPWFWHIFVDTLDKFPLYIIQSKTSASDQ